MVHVIQLHPSMQLTIATLVLLWHVYAYSRANRMPLTAFRLESCFNYSSRECCFDQVACSGTQHMQFLAVGCDCKFSICTSQHNNALSIANKQQNQQLLEFARNPLTNTHCSQSYHPGCGRLAGTMLKPGVIDAQPDADTQGRSVLLAEDNLINQRVAKMMLCSLGMCCEVASNGQEAVDAVLRRIGRADMRQFDVLLMDMAMPVMGGVDATKVCCCLFEAVNALSISTVTANFYMSREVQGAA